MHVVVDALFARSGSGLTYLSNFLRRDPPEGISVTVLTTPSLATADTSPRFRLVRTAPMTENPAARTLWLETQLPAFLRAEGADLLFAPGGIVLLRERACRAATMFHNVLPFHSVIKEYTGYQRFRLHLLRRLLVRSMESAEKVIFVSEFGRHLVCDELRVNVRNSAVVPNGVESTFFIRDAQRPPWFPLGRVITYVSPIEPYKDQLVVVKGFARFLDQRGKGDEQLALIGAEHPTYGRTVRREAQRLGVSRRVHFIGQLPHSELPDALRSSACTVFASRCENAPITVLEALASGRPLVCSDLAATREVAGGLQPYYFSTGSVCDFARALADALDDGEDRSLEDVGTLRKEHDWDVIVRQTWDELVDVL